MHLRKPLLNTIIAFSAAALSVSSTRANLLAYEGFDYPAATSLTDLNGGTGFSGGWSVNKNSFSTNTSGLTYSTLPTVGLASSSSDGQAVRSLSAPLPTSGSVYISILTNQTSVSYANLALFNGDTEEVSFGDIYVGSPSDVYGINKNNSFGGGSELSSVAINTAGSEFLVFRLDYDSVPGSTVVSLYTDPALTSTLTDLAAVSFTAGSVVSLDRIRVEASAGSTIDEIRIGTTYADVTAVPEPSTTAVVLSLLCGVMVVIRRRRSSF